MFHPFHGFRNLKAFKSIFHFKLRSQYSRDNRKDPHLITNLLRKESTNIIIFKRLKPLISTVENNVHSLQFTKLSTNQFNEIKDYAGIQVHVAGNNPIIGFSSYDERIDGLPSLLKEKFDINSSWMSFQFDFLKLKDIEIWKQLRSLFAWHYCNIFCGICGSATISVDSGYKRMCTNNSCFSKKLSWSNYPRIDPVVAVLPVTKKSPSNGFPACCLSRKNIFPGGVLSCITGFIEQGESVETAAKRELKEELGLDSNMVLYTCSEFWPMPSSELLGYMVDVPELTNFVLDDQELSFAKWFDPDETKLLLERKHPKFCLPPSSTIFYNLVKIWYSRLQ